LFLRIFATDAWPGLVASPVFGTAMQTSFDKSKIKVLLLEGIHANAQATLAAAGYRNVTALDHALSGAELEQVLASHHMLGIRSRTQLTAPMLQHAQRLMAVGCFCIGTNQVDVDAAASLAIPVFNAPFSNTRSVAELVLAEAILLLRGVPERSMQMHAGNWQKSAKGSFEVRGKTLGIVGYGNIGAQLGVLGEALGMQVQPAPANQESPTNTTKQWLRGNRVCSGACASPSLCTRDTPASNSTSDSNTRGSRCARTAR
jgi:D-3-phosphoglycerate dehydrogenase